MEGGLQAALAAHQAGDTLSAERLYRDVLAKRESHSAAGNLGVILSARGAWPEAEAAHLRAIALRPDHPNHRRNLGNLYLKWGRLADAAEAYRAALELDPADVLAKRGLGHALLGLGRPEGWTFNDERQDRYDTPARGLAYPEWRGEPLAGKRLFLMGEQGLGDQIFAARYIAGLGCAVTMAAAPPLVRLFEQIPRVTVIPRRGVLAVPEHDFWALPLSLPRWAKAAEVPYLAAAPRPTGRFGIAWRGNALPDPGRTLPLEVAERLLSHPGAVSLQPEDTGAADFLDTAEIVAGLDFVVSIDTSVAHLAGAMGKPGVVLLQHYPRDWRWREGAPGRSFWYPSLQIIRQARPDDWHTAVDQTLTKTMTTRPMPPPGPPEPNWHPDPPP